MRIYPILMIALAVGALGVPEASAHTLPPIENTAVAPHLTESQKVEQLIAFVSSMKGATFIRNGSKHSCQEAAEHLRTKWEKHKDKVKTAEEFIDKLASKSGMSGEDYLIQFKDGHTETSAAVLYRKLKQLEKQ